MLMRKPSVSCICAGVRIYVSVFVSVFVPVRVFVPVSGFARICANYLLWNQT